ncbi:AMP-binding protein [Mesorhizobium sp. B2-4-19]|uniref:AMP-binding protein n=1 Tax=Mesorhizobium sp. B2-4-19 TaxID=2589930 RepID=UPI001127AEE3|nr:AMP-binding protein [Mesorhizobium sp. B2-4-19]TPK54859.1 AMP-binding protein [Mesorhizobium sp. B2-4-19]
MAFVDKFGSRGDAVALSLPNRKAITYAELDRRTDGLCRNLGARRKLIAVEACASEHAIIAYLAALRGRHAVALLPPGDDVAVSDFEEDFAPDVVFRKSDGRWRSTNMHRPNARNLHPDLSLLLGTSGSTGKRRFVRLSAKAVEANAGSIASFLGLDASDRAALILPLHYSYGLSVLNSHLAVGAAIHLAAHGTAQSGFLEEMLEAGCTNISGVPYCYELMERVGVRAESLPALRFMTAAGGRMQPDLVECWRQRLAGHGKQLFLMYGQTEATARVAYVPPEKLAENTDSIGIAIPGGSLRLVDDTGAPVEEAGRVGELVYRGPNVMMGYAENGDDLSRGHEIDELKTGDIAERDVDGLYRIVGRRKRFSKIAGLRINHAAIEHALSQAGLSGAVVGNDRRLMAAIPSGHSPERARGIMARASGLSLLHVDAFCLDHLPRLTSGKVDYVAIAARLEADAIVGEANADLLDAFRRAFCLSNVGPNDSFESLGGDSLLYVQLSLALDRELGQVPEGWEKRPIREIAATARIDGASRIVDTELPLRALAITLIVIHHATLWPIPAGAAILMVLVGHGIARFHSATLFAGDPWRLMKSLAMNLAIYAPIVIGYSLAWGEVLWPSILLVGNLELTDPTQKLPYLYWFVEAYAQITLLWVAIFAFAPLRRFASRNPFNFGIGFLGLAVAAKFAVPLVWHVGPAQIFTTPDVLYLAVIGWCIYFALSSPTRLLMLCATAFLFSFLAYMGGNWTGSWVKFVLLFVAVAALLYMPRVHLPRWLVRAVLPLAAAGYNIYLFHRILPELLLPQPDPAYLQPGIAALAVVGGISTGLAIRAAQNKAMTLLTYRRVAVSPGGAPPPRLPTRRWRGLRAVRGG